jgi:chemotaxis protein methyltransferase CheR
MPSSVSTTLLARLSALAEGRLGLNFPPERSADLERVMQVAAQEQGSETTEEYIRGILSESQPTRQAALLAASLTVGETYFFREKASFNAFESSVFPPLIAARRLYGKTLRLWSAGCCSGEEPYSLAILLCRLLPDISDWDVTLLATDINPLFLQKAEEGIYSDWSFRSAPPWLKRNYFTEISPGRWEIRPRIKKMVTFRTLNLATDPYPDKSSGTASLDLILCRNVLIYMAPAQINAIVDRFYASLADGGCLSVSPAEASARIFSQFETLNLPGATLFRKGAGEAAPPQPVLLPPLPRAADETTPVALVPPRPIPAPDPLAMARACADAGDLDAALRWCDAALLVDKIDPISHYLRGTILQEQGTLESAAQSFRAALLLDPNFVLAYFALGSLARRQGQEPEANKHFRQALALLRDFAPDEIVPESEGMVASHLSEMIQSMLSSEEER